MICFPSWVSLIQNKPKKTRNGGKKAYSGKKLADADSQAERLTDKRTEIDKQTTGRQTDRKAPKHTGTLTKYVSLFNQTHGRTHAITHTRARVLASSKEMKQ